MPRREIDRNQNLGLAEELCDERARHDGRRSARVARRRAHAQAGIEIEVSGAGREVEVMLPRSGVQA
jgi:hypothetical protein